MTATQWVAIRHLLKHSKWYCSNFQLITQLCDTYVWKN